MSPRCTAETGDDGCEWVIVVCLVDDDACVVNLSTFEPWELRELESSAWGLAPHSQDLLLLQSSYTT